MSAPISLLFIHSIVQEYNQEYEFHWEEFSLAELENFSKILDREEEAAREQVRALHVYMCVCACVRACVCAASHFPLIDSWHR